MESHCLIQLSEFAWYPCPAVYLHPLTPYYAYYYYYYYYYHYYYYCCCC